MGSSAGRHQRRGDGYIASPAGRHPVRVCRTARVDSDGLQGEPLRQSRPYLTPGCMVGVLFALEFLFVAEGLRFTSASHMAVFLYTAPAFAAIGLQLFHPDERLVPAQWAGIFIAFTGIAVAFLSGSSGTGDVVRILTGDAMGLMAGLAWGATTVVVRCTALSQAPATHTLFYQLSGACALLSVYALFSGQHHFRPGITAGLSLIFQIFIVGFASYLTWFSLMKTYLASQLGVLSFMTPVFGVIAGMLLLGEEPQPGFSGVRCSFSAGSSLSAAGRGSLRSWVVLLHLTVHPQGEIHESAYRFCPSRIALF